MTAQDTTPTPMRRDYCATDRHAALDAWARFAEEQDRIDPSLFPEYDVKRGLRDHTTGKGVLAGLTQIGDVVGTKVEGDILVPAPGMLFYRGHEVNDLVTGFVSGGHHGFEETAYLLLLGKLPDAEELDRFEDYLSTMRKMPRAFVYDALLLSPSRDIMNAMARGVLALYTLDKNADDTSTCNVLRQSLHLIAKFPMLAVYAYQAYLDEYHGKSLVIHRPVPEYSTAENFLHMLRPNSSFTELEALVLDMTLVLHAEHGGGNNSTFAARVVSSTNTDTYSAIAAALGSLKGPRHGGANLKVVEMFADMRENVSDCTDDEQIANYLHALLEKRAFDGAGLVYGMGHPVYSVSDPRAIILHEYAKKLADEKGHTEEFALHERVEQLAPLIIAGKRRVFKGVSANVDFYSGLIYQMLDIPAELFTPLFAISRVAGWSAHRLEELAGGKLIRPAYKSVAAHEPYVPLEDR